MRMIDFIIIGILLVVVLAVVRYLHVRRAQGVRCIGCPNCKQCASRRKTAVSCSGKG